MSARVAPSPMLSDLRLTARALAKSPAYVFVAVFTLALGIGVNAAMFGLVNAMVLRGLPFAEQHRLLHVGSEQRSRGGFMAMSVPDFIDLRASQHSFVDLAAYDERRFNLASPGADPERVEGALISAAGLTLLREPALLGRWFQPDDEQRGAAPVAVLGYAIWQNRFAGRQTIIGQSVKIDGEWATIVGVAPRNFRFPEIADVWMPLKLKTDASRSDRWLQVFGRLRDGVTPQQAQAEVGAFGRQLETAHSDTNRDIALTATPLKDEFVDEGTRRLLDVMFGAVGLVLLIACANVANLILSRSAVRAKEIAVRFALGATRGHIIRLLLLETSVLSLAGAAIGLPLAYGLMAALNADVRTSTIPIPYWLTLDIDAKGIAYVLGLACLTCVLAGLWPAWLTSRADLNTVLKDSARGSTGFTLSRTSRLMVIGEVVLSAVLLVLSALTIRSVVNSQQAALGFHPEGVFSAQLGLKDEHYNTAQKQIDFCRELMRRLEAKPGIAGAAISNLTPTQANRTQVEFEGKPRGGPTGSGLPEQYAARLIVSGSYFATLGIPLVSGRTFDDRDTATSQRVAVVSTRFAEQHWPREDPIGKRFVYGTGLNVKPDEWFTVVGVVSPSLQSYARGMIDVPQTFIAHSQLRNTQSTFNLFVRHRNPAAVLGVADTVRSTLREVDPDQPIYLPQTLDAMVQNARFMKGLIAWIFGIFGGVALVLAGVGLYGVMSYSVSQRTQEIGVRMALGAEPRDVLTMILREGGLRLGFGLLFGLPAAYFAGRLLAFILYGVQPYDIPAFTGTLAVLAAAGFVACLVPALRAIRVSPMDALRCE